MDLGYEEDVLELYSIVRNARRKGGKSFVASQGARGSNQTLLGNLLPAWDSGPGPRDLHNTLRCRRQRYNEYGKEQTRSDVKAQTPCRVVNRCSFCPLSESVQMCTGQVSITYTLG